VQNALKKLGIFYEGHQSELLSRLRLNLQAYCSITRRYKTMSLILIIILILLLVGGLPVFPHSRNWGYGPSGILGVVLVVLLVLLLLGRI
jgi:hypothetical protein